MVRATNQERRTFEARGEPRLYSHAEHRKREESLSDA